MQASQEGTASRQVVLEACLQSTAALTASALILRFVTSQIQARWPFLDSSRVQRLLASTFLFRAKLDCDFVNLISYAIFLMSDPDAHLCCLMRTLLSLE